jgi:hypothetical protein
MTRISTSAWTERYRLADFSGDGEDAAFTRRSAILARARSAVFRDFESGKTCHISVQKDYIRACGVASRILADSPR